MKIEAQTEFQPATREIYETFDEEMTALGGTITDRYDDGARLFVRALLPSLSEVCPGDQLRSGVALRTSGPEVLVHPYTLRLVCTNGAVQAHALETRRVERLALDSFIASAHSYAVAGALAAIGEAVRACAAPSAFASAVDEMRSAAEMDADFLLDMLSLVSHWPQVIGNDAVLQLLQRLMPTAGSDRSVFALGNVLTAAGRDAHDPETRWQLEKLGAEVFACSMARQEASTRSELARRIVVALLGIGAPAAIAMRGLADAEAEGSALSGRGHRGGAA